MASLLEKSVTKAADGTWGFQCPGVREDPCGVIGGEGFSSTQWPTKQAAMARGAQHFDAHRLGLEVQAGVRRALEEADDPDSVDRVKVAEAVARKSAFKPMQELGEFREDQGLVVNDDGSVSVKDL